MFSKRNFNLKKKKKYSFTHLFLFLTDERHLQVSGFFLGKKKQKKMKMIVFFLFLSQQEVKQTNSELIFQNYSLVFSRFFFFYLCLVSDNAVRDNLFTLTWLDKYEQVSFDDNWSWLYFYILTLVFFSLKLFVVINRL
jgi:hypothetical protein